MENSPVAEKVLAESELKRFQDEQDKTGIVYLSRIPPLMGPQELRNHLVPFGMINRVYLTPADAKSGIKKGKKQHQKKVGGVFVDGWVEFKSKKSAKNAALALNGTTVQGNKRSKFFGELWAIKYLPKFKWANLTEQIAYEKAVRDQKMRTEISQATREAGLYMKQVEKAHEIEKIAEKRAAKKAAVSVQMEDVKQTSGNDQDALEKVRKKFRQRKPINK